MLPPSNRAALLTNTFLLLVAIFFMYSPDTMANQSEVVTFETPRCRTLTAEHVAAFSLDFIAFDQTRQGWRFLSDRKCYISAANFIVDYIKIHPELETWMVGHLYFEAGQSFAFAKRNRDAIALMKKSFGAAPPNTAIHWDPYVIATISFLSRNKTKLIKSRDMMLLAVDDEVDPNLIIVENMILYFNRPYPFVFKLAMEEKINALEGIPNLLDVQQMY